ncbi:MAG: chorismate mutase [Erysipelotrichales bacterium]|nr:chorismate mutase [Erysipelotrichales bacterium]
MEEINILRNKIDICDKKIVDLIFDRLELCKQIGKIKKENNLNVIDNNRWQNIIDKIIKLAKNKSNKETEEDYVYLIINIYNLIHETSCNLQKNE